jgi:hypothetical protein
MAWLKGSFGRTIFLASLVLLSACDQVGSVLPAAQDGAKYELKQDSQGRTIRLNKSTGEVEIIDGTATSVEQSRAEAPSTLPKASGSTSRISNRSSSFQSKPPTASKEIQLDAPPAVAHDALSVNQPAPSVGSRLTITSQTAILAERTRRPLIQLASGTVVTLLRSSTGEFYTVQFEDPIRGLFFGLVDKRFVSVAPLKTEATDVAVGRREPGRNTPMDLSIREPKPKRNEPIDLSITVHKLQPVDLSVPPSNGTSSEPVDLSVPMKARERSEPMDLSVPNPK